jgi:pyruvate/2-oxoglutarate dehydrogenase complex dihydrolipoamide acyltransferase (E2) component
MQDVIVPKVGMASAEVDVVTWHVQVGAVVAPGSRLADIESEKATIEIESPCAGVVAEIRVPAGSTVAPGTVLCRIRPA